MSRSLSTIAIGLILGVLGVAAHSVLADPYNLSRDPALDVTRASIPITGDSATGAHIELTITGASAGNSTAMTKGSVYRIGCTVATICEFAAAAPTADTNSAYYVGAGSYDYFLVRPSGGTDNDFIACISEDGATAGVCYISKQE